MCRESFFSLPRKKSFICRLGGARQMVMSTCPPQCTVILHPRISQGKELSDETVSDMEQLILEHSLTSAGPQQPRQPCLCSTSKGRSPSKESHARAGMKETVNAVCTQSVSQLCPELAATLSGLC